MNDVVHLVTEIGRDRGKTVTVAPGGVRVGRSSRNDVMLDDPLMSRHHCRFFFKDGALWVGDLGSANETLVNDQTVQECALNVGDRVILGDTTLRVVHNRATGNVVDVPGSVVDLGLAPDSARPTPKALGKGPLLIVGVLVAALALAIWVPQLLPRKPAPEPLPVPVEEPTPDTLAIEYEKVQATPANIFRYSLQLTAGHQLSVQIDDIENDRHVRKEKPLDPDYVQSLVETMADSGFFGLQEEYQGIQPDVLESWDLSITIGQRTHRTRIVNRVEPDVFRHVREIIEECGKNELGLWAIQFSPEKLRVMARDSYLEAQRLYDGRAVQYGNLAAALRAYDEAEWYLETVEPKPDYYSEMLTAANRADEELQRRYDDLNFSAERSIRLREWEQAAVELRVILETIPDRTDERHQKARRKLLDMENRIKALK